MEVILKWYGNTNDSVLVCMRYSDFIYYKWSDLYLNYFFTYRCLLAIAHARLSLRSEVCYWIFELELDYYCMCISMISEPQYFKSNQFLISPVAL